MIKKVFTSIIFFILVFTVISAIADVYYRYRLISDDSGKQVWTCRCDFRVFWTAGYRINNYAFSAPGALAGGLTARAVYPGYPEYEKDLEGYIDFDRSQVYDKSEPFYHFRYSPLAAFFMIPFSMIAYPVNALTVWLILLNISLLAALLLLTRQIYLDFNISRNVRYLILWSAFIVSLKFYFMNISNGQSDVIIALLFVLFLMAYTQGREIICGIILAFIAQFKPQFIPILLYFLLSGKKKLVLSALLGFLAFLFAPAVLIGFGKTMVLLKDWKEILSLSISSQLLNYKNQSITYFIGKSLLGISALKASVQIDRLFYIISAILTTSAYIALLLFRKLSKAAEDKKFRYLEISVLIIITLLFSPLVWVANFICLIIPAGVMALFLSTSRNKMPLYIALTGFFMLSVIMGTDLTNFIPFINDMHFINISTGGLFLIYALVYSYKQQV